MSYRIGAHKETYSYAKETYSYAKETYSHANETYSYAKEIYACAKKDIYKKDLSFPLSRPNHGVSTPKSCLIV